MFCLLFCIARFLLTTFLLTPAGYSAASAPTISRSIANLMNVFQLNPKVGD
eukprot:m.36968 g.36968  ORF g.36968 m.36968 type:complete len:51 (-) comp11483_c0_seq1:650-802(-)